MEDVIKTRKSVTLKRGTDIQSKKAFLTMWKSELHRLLVLTLHSKADQSNPAQHTTALPAALRKEKLCPCLPTCLPTPGHRQHTRHSSATFSLPPELFASRCTPRVYFTFLFPVLLYVSVAERCVKIKAAARKLGRISQGSGSGCRLLSTHTVQSSS